MTTGTQPGDTETQVTTEVKAPIEGQEEKQEARAVPKANPEQIIGMLQTKVAQLERDLAVAKVPTEMLQGIMEEQKRTRRTLIELNPDLDETQRSAQLSQLSAEEQTTKETAEFNALSKRLGNRIVAKLAKLEIAMTHPKVQEFNKDWGAALTKDARHDVYEQIDDWLEEEKEDRNKKVKEEAERMVTEAKQQYNRETGALEQGAGRGTPAGAPPSWDALKQVDTRFMNPKELKEHRAKLNAVIVAAK